MASDWNASLKQINGIDLNNYFPQQRTYNSVVFVHKRCMKESKPDEKQTKEKLKPKKDKVHKQDKCQQSNNNKGTEYSKDRTYKISNNDNSVLEHTIKFAKNIVPLVIPSEDKTNVFYTIKASKKQKRKTTKKVQEPSFDRLELMREREEPIKLVEMFKKVTKESVSIKESLSHSSSNTLDDLNINQSLCCTFSEVSEKKYRKKDKTCTKKNNQRCKFAISESFEAVATENTAGDGKIKIHLMNEKDKHFLSESIKEPVLNAIRECILELNNNNNNLHSEVTTVQKVVKCNSQKLDDILSKLTCIKSELDTHEKKLSAHEKKLCIHEKKIDLAEKSLNSREKKLDTYMNKIDFLENKQNAQKEDRNCTLKEQYTKSKNKPSTLEELSEDLIEIKDGYSSEEELHQELLDRRSKSSTVIDLQEAGIKEKKKVDGLGGGEVTSSMKASSSVGAEKLERPHRIPARFCWTEAGRKN